jgi:hypothetical protein
MLIVAGPVGTVDKPSMLFRSAYPSSLWKSLEKKSPKASVSISSAAAVSTGLPLSERFFLFWFFFLSL